MEKVNFYGIEYFCVKDIENLIGGTSAFDKAFRGCTLLQDEDGAEYIPCRDVSDKINLGYVQD